MTTDELDREYARQLTAMAAARVEHENPRHLRLMARETRQRRGAEMPAPEPGAEIRIWADLHFDDERIRRAAERPWPEIEPMNAALRRSWRESMATGAAMVCAGDIGGPPDLLRTTAPAGRGAFRACGASSSGTTTSRASSAARGRRGPTPLR